MENFTIFDPALCCNSGVCGTDVDQSLVNFSADLQWLKDKGVTVERFNLSQQPMAFVDNPIAKRLLENSGTESLPLIIFNEEMVLAGRYPTRQELASWAKVPMDISVTKITACCSEKTNCC